MNGKYVCSIPMGIRQIFKSFPRLILALFFAFILGTPSSYAQVKVIQGGNVGVKTEIPSEALEVNGKIKVNELSEISQFLIGLDGNQTLSSLGIGLGLLLEDGVLKIDPDQVGGNGGNGWSLQGNNITGVDGDFIGTVNEHPLIIAIDEDPKYEFDEFGRIIPVDTHIKIGANTGIENSNIQTSDNVFIGNGVSSNRNGSYNNIIGKDAGKGEAPEDFPPLNSRSINESYNNIIGYEAGYYSEQYSKFNNFIGTRAGAGGNYLEEEQEFEPNTGSYNNFIGFETGFKNTNSSNNNFIGKHAGREHTNGNRNNYIGEEAGSNANSYNNNYIGHRAGQGSTVEEGVLIKNVGNNNNFIGPSTGQFNTTGSKNNFIGFLAGVFNRIGNENVLIGSNSGYINNSGNENVFVGKSSGFHNISGDNNTAIGTQADFALYNENEDDEDYGDIEFNSGFSSLSNATSIGNLALVNTSNKLRLGNITLEIVETNGLFVEVSDKRFKNNIQENIPGLGFITQLKPVSYNFDTEAFDLHLMQGMADSTIVSRTEGVDYTESSNKIRTGFLAQDVETICKDIGYDFDGVSIADPNNPTDNYGLSYSSFVVPLVQAVKEQQVMIEDLEKQRSEQQDIIKDLITRIEKLEQN